MTALQSMATCLAAFRSWGAYGEFLLLTMRLFRFPVVRVAFSRSQTATNCSNQRLRRIGRFGGKAPDEATGSGLQFKVPHQSMKPQSDVPSTAH